MSEKPFFRADGWMASETQDYAALKTDEDRRRMLLVCGYDEAHRAEAERLFSPQGEPPRPEPNWAKWSVAVGILGVLVAIVVFVLDRLL